MYSGHLHALSSFMSWTLSGREEDPVVKAIRAGDVETLRQITRKSDCNVLAPNQSGWIPLHEAAYYGQDQCVKALLKGKGNTIICTYFLFCTRLSTSFCFVLSVPWKHNLGWLTSARWRIRLLFSWPCPGKTQTALKAFSTKVLTQIFQIRTKRRPFLKVLIRQQRLVIHSHHCCLHWVSANAKNTL